MDGARKLFHLFNKYGNASSKCFVMGVWNQIPLPRHRSFCNVSYRRYIANSPLLRRPGTCRYKHWTTCMFVMNWYRNYGNSTISICVMFPCLFWPIDACGLFDYSWHYTVYFRNIHVYWCMRVRWHLTDRCMVFISLHVSDCGICSDWTNAVQQQYTYIK